MFRNLKKTKFQLKKESKITFFCICPTLVFDQKLFISLVSEIYILHKLYSHVRYKNAYHHKKFQNFSIKTIIASPDLKNWLWAFRGHVLIAEFVGNSSQFMPYAISSVSFEQGWVVLISVLILSDFILICFHCLCWQCRLAGLTYRGIFTADVCMQWNNGVVIRHNVSYGKMPVMVKVQF